MLPKIHVDRSILLLRSLIEYNANIRATRAQLEIAILVDLALEKIEKDLTN